ncbi:MAG TPA: zf-HC2 domain-containing protein [Terriglobales bacterium]|nr:zf-HC2 domain-containing protein [Terriglobales bacterium]
MTCADAKSLFSPYLDGAIPGTQMHALGQHLESCVPCHREYDLLLQSQHMLTTLGRKRAPADLALKLRVLISQEAAQARRPRFEGLRVRVENAINAFMVPATAGLVAAIVIFAVLMGFLTVPDQALANSKDVPLMLYSDPEMLPPELQSSAFAMTAGSVHSDSLVIEAVVGSDGRVQDYRILSDPKESEDMLPQVKNMLILMKFRPAMSLGRNTTGRAVLSFSKISVKG